VQVFLLAGVCSGTTLPWGPYVFEANTSVAPPPGVALPYVFTYVMGAPGSVVPDPLPTFESDQGLTITVSSTAEPWPAGSTDISECTVFVCTTTYARFARSIVLRRCARACILGDRVSVSFVSHLVVCSFHHDNADCQPS
jgi:hypothetical protein